MYSLQHFLRDILYSILQNQIPVLTSAKYADIRIYIDIWLAAPNPNRTQSPQSQSNHDIFCLLEKIQLLLALS
jgi:hypothetical protein